MAASSRQMRTARGRFHCWLASSMICTCGPTASRTMKARRTSRAVSAEPTFSFMALNPASTARLAFSRTWSSL